MQSPEGLEDSPFKLCRLKFHFPDAGSMTSYTLLLTLGFKQLDYNI